MIQMRRSRWFNSSAKTMKTSGSERQLAYLLFDKLYTSFNNRSTPQHTSKCMVGAARRSRLTALKVSLRVSASWLPISFCECTTVPAHQLVRLSNTLVDSLHRGSAHACNSHDQHHALHVLYPVFVAYAIVVEFSRSRNDATSLAS